MERKSKTNWRLDELEREYDRLLPPKDWLKEKNSKLKAKLVIYGLMYLVLLGFLWIGVSIINEEGAFSPWLFAVLPIGVVFYKAFFYLQNLELTLYKLEWRFHLRKRLREIGKKMDESDKNNDSPYLGDFSIKHGRDWVEPESWLSWEDEKLIGQLAQIKQK